MVRDHREIERSKRRIEVAIANLQEELAALNHELAMVANTAQLNESFFWEHVATNLFELDVGVTSSELARILEARGHNIKEENFRTFLSRQKAKGRLQLNKGEFSTVLWGLSPSARNLVGKLRGVSS